MIYKAPLFQAASPIHKGLRLHTTLTMHTRLLRAALIVLLMVGLLRETRPRLARALPADFSDSLLATLDYPTALAFTPDGRMLITTQIGRLYIYQNNALLSTPALDLTAVTCSDAERGMLGVAVDPDFASTLAIYIAYTRKRTPSCPVANPSQEPLGRVSRFTLSASNVATDEFVLLDNIPSPGAIHNGGDLQFGKDGYLYISVGDGGCQITSPSSCGGSNQNSRRQDILNGKVLRIRSDGSLPSDNPWMAATGARLCGDPKGLPAGSGPCKETFLWGLRNPWRMGFDPNASATRFFVNDTGQDTWEEIDLAQSGADYGWNTREGHCVNGSTTSCAAPPAGMTNPIFDYNHSTGCTAVTGGAFVPNGAWPTSYDGAYLYSDYVCGTIFQLMPSGSTYASSTFASGLGTIVAMTFGPYGTSQALYYIDYTTMPTEAQIRRIAYTGSANRSPVAAVSASPAYGSLPLSVSFNGSQSKDPNGTALTYLWNFGDGSAASQTSSATTSHVYTTSGTYNATLQVRDTAGTLSNVASVRIDAGNTPPTPSISAPLTSARFRVGQTITLTGSASDAQDGTLSSSALRWQVMLHHDTHIHPFLQATSGNNITFVAPQPESLLAANNSYLEIVLTAIDARGLATTIKQELRPNLVNLTFNTQPSGLKLTVSGSTLTGPQTTGSWEGYLLNLKAQVQKNAQGTVMTFQSWSDGGAASHSVTTPASPATYTASFVADSFGRGQIVRQYWLGLPNDNGAVSDLTSRSSYPHSPSGTEVVPDFEGPTDWNEGYGQRIAGYVYPPTTGAYTFWISSDDNSELWLSTDASATNRVRIAWVPEFSGSRQWFDFAEQQSAPINLVAGQRYYIEAIHKEAGGGDNLAVAWMPPGGALDLLSGVYISPLSPLPTPNLTRTSTRTVTRTSSPQIINTPTLMPTSPSVIYPAWDGNGKAYAIGTMVSFEGRAYKCILEHVSQPDWSPDQAPALWHFERVLPTATPGAATVTRTRTSTGASSTATRTRTRTSTGASSTATRTRTRTSTGASSTATRTRTNTAIPTQTRTPTAPTETPLTSYPAWNPNSQFYQVGAMVSYNGRIYRCRQAHTSQPGWTPEAVPALWELV